MPKNAKTKKRKDFESSSLTLEHQADYKWFIALETENNRLKQQMEGVKTRREPRWLEFRGTDVTPVY